MSIRRAGWLLLLVAAAASVGGCAEDVVRPDGEIRLESEHFVVVASRHRASQAEADAVMRRAESLFTRVSAYVGPLRTPDQRIRILLTGDQTESGSYVDFDGIHLARYSADAGGYLAVLAHELVHAFGVEWFVQHEVWDWPTYRYFDEGFAEYLAQEVDPEKRGFPFFGYPEDAVAGHWLSAGQAIPHGALRARHEELNERCDLQAYTLRASWMRHLEGIAGRAALLAVVYPEQEPTSPVVRAATGLDLETLDTAWEAWLRERFETRQDTATVREGFQDRTRWYTPCLAGAEY